MENIHVLNFFVIKAGFTPFFLLCRHNRVIVWFTAGFPGATYILFRFTMLVSLIFHLLLLRSSKQILIFKSFQNTLVSEVIMFDIFKSSVMVCFYTFLFCIVVSSIWKHFKCLSGKWTVSSIHAAPSTYNVAVLKKCNCFDQFSSWIEEEHIKASTFLLWHFVAQRF